MAAHSIARSLRSPYMRLLFSIWIAVSLVAWLPLSATAQACTEYDITEGVGATIEMQSDEYLVVQDWTISPDIQLFLRLNDPLGAIIGTMTPDDWEPGSEDSYGYGSPSLYTATAHHFVRLDAIGFDSPSDILLVAHCPSEVPTPGPTATPAPDINCDENANLESNEYYIFNSRIGVGCSRSGTASAYTAGPREVSIVSNLEPGYYGFLVVCSKIPGGLGDPYLGFRPNGGDALNTLGFSRGAIDLTYGGQVVIPPGALNRSNSWSWYIGIGASSGDYELRCTWSINKIGASIVRLLSNGGVELDVYDVPSSRPYDTLRVQERPYYPGMAWQITGTRIGATKCIFSFDWGSHPTACDIAGGVALYKSGSAVPSEDVAILVLDDVSDTLAPNLSGTPTTWRLVSYGSNAAPSFVRWSILATGGATATATRTSTPPPELCDPVTVLVTSTFLTSGSSDMSQEVVLRLAAAVPVSVYQDTDLVIELTTLGQEYILDRGLVAEFTGISGGPSSSLVDVCIRFYGPATVTATATSTATGVTSTATSTATATGTGGTATSTNTATANTATSTQSPTTSTSATATATDMATATETATVAPTVTLPPECLITPHVLECEIIMNQRTQIAQMELTITPRGTGFVITGTVYATSSANWSTIVAMLCSREPCAGVSTVYDGVGTALDTLDGVSAPTQCATSLHQPFGGSGDWSVSDDQLSTGFCWFVDESASFRSYMRQLSVLLFSLMVISYFVLTFRRLGDV